MSREDSGGYIDGQRTCSLHDVGGANLLAATLVGARTTILAIVDTDHLDDPNPIDPRCRNATHEQLGPLPLEIVRRLTIAARKHRDDERPTEC